MDAVWIRNWLNMHSTFNMDSIWTQYGFDVDSESIRYRPEENSRLERFHKTLGQKMKAACPDHASKEWDTYIKQVVFAYNCTPHSSTRYSPAQLVYERQPLFPFDVMMDPFEEEAPSSHKEYILKARERLRVWHVKPSSRYDFFIFSHCHITSGVR